MRDTKDLELPWHHCAQCAQGDARRLAHLFNPDWDRHELTMPLEPVNPKVKAKHGASRRTWDVHSASLRNVQGVPRVPRQCQGCGLSSRCERHPRLNEKRCAWHRPGPIIASSRRSIGTRHLSSVTARVYTITASSRSSPNASTFGITKRPCQGRASTLRPLPVRNLLRLYLGTKFRLKELPDLPAD